MKFLFLGTPRFAAIILEKLIAAGMPPTLVVTNPDRPAGRKKILTPPPTKLIAEKNGVAVWQPEKLEIGNWKLEISKLGGIKFAVVAAYNKILKKELLDSVKFIGIHPSLLPLLRGASPIQSALLLGHKETGTTLYILDKDVDHGPIISQKSIALPPEENYLSLEKKLAELGAEMLINDLPQFSAGKIIPKPQDHSRATFTKKFKTEDGFVDLKKDAPETIYRKIKALNPEPGAYTFINNIRAKLLDARLADGKICLTEIQEAGKLPKKVSICL